MNGKFKLGDRVKFGPKDAVIQPAEGCYPEIDFSKYRGTVVQPQGVRQFEGMANVEWDHDKGCAPFYDESRLEHAEEDQAKCAGCGQFYRPNELQHVELIEVSLCRNCYG